MLLVVRLGNRLVYEKRRSHMLDTLEEEDRTVH